jgi:hypothetical protein
MSIRHVTIAKSIAFASLLCFSLSVLANEWADARADRANDLVRLESIQMLSEKDNQAALKQLQAFYAQMSYVSCLPPTMMRAMFPRVI